MSIPPAGDTPQPERAAPSTPHPGAPSDARGDASSQEPIRFGSMTALLEEIAAAPEDARGAGWEGSLVQGAVVLDRFEMIREIGRGGLGVVWEARDRRLDRRVAFEAVRAEAPPSLREKRLLSEAEAAAKLSHPNLVTLHDVGRTEQGPYLVLELLEGETLEARLGRGPIPVRETVRIAVEVAKGLAHGHFRGVVHRDLEPANVFLCRDGRVKVLDFGMAHAFGRRRERRGTPYTAPEQRAGAPEDERSDVFALGAMIFEMLAGEPAFPEAAREASPPWRRTPTLEVPGQPALADLVARMLERDPTDRPRDGGAVVAKLSEVQLAIEASSTTPSPPVRARRRAPWRVLAPIAAAVLLGILVAIALARRPPAAAPGEDGRLVVAVADFANETRDPDLDGLSGLLITSLEQSKSLRVLTRGRLVDLVREHGEGDARHIDESTARAVGRKAGIRALLLASIQKLGDTYVAELRAVDPWQDGYLFALREQAATKDELLPLVDRLSDRIRLALREPEAAVQASGVKLGEAVTGNLEAYRHYFRGKDFAARGGALAEALEEFRRAAELDPHFVLPRVEAAWIGYFAGTTDRAAAREIVREASRDAARVPEKEAGLTRVLAAFFDGGFADSRARVLALLARYPDDRDAAVLAAAILGWCGYYEDALPALERALRLAPEWDFLGFQRVELLATLGRAEEALQLAEEAARAHRTPTAWAVVGIARYAVGDLEGGLSAFRSSGAEDPYSRSLLAQGLAAQGRMKEALAAVAPFRDALGDRTRAQVLAYAGRLREGLVFLDAAARYPGADVGWARQIAARYLAAAGDVERARAAAAQGGFFGAIEGPMLAAVGDEYHLGQLVGHLEQGSTFTLRFLRALSLHRAGDRERALAELRALDRGTVSFVPYFHGLVAAEAGLHEEAVEAFRRFERPVYWASDPFEAPWLLARARLLTARSLDRLGRREEARQVLDRQLARWKDADPDLALLAELKALRSALESGPSVK